MVERLGKTLNEVFAMVPNSFQDYSSQIRLALNDDPPEGFSKNDWAYVEAIIGDEPDQVLVECYHSDTGKCSYYLFDVAFENGSVKWSNQREVEVEAAIKAKPAMERRMNETVDPPQTAVVDASDFDISFAAEDKKFASVAIAQKAEVKNRNNRIYPTEVLEDAVERLKNRIRLMGPIAMETAHRDERYIGDVCAVIHEVHFDKASGVVTLPKIEFPETTAAKNVLALLEVVPSFQVSQRGVGISHEETDPNTGQKVTVMDWLQIDGWDLVWNGDASVEEAVLTLNENVLEEGQQQQQAPPQQQQQQAPPQRPVNSYFSQRGQQQQAPPQQQQQSALETQPLPQQQQQAPPQQQQQQEPPQQVLLGKEVVGLVKTTLTEMLGPMKASMEQETDELRRKEFRREAEGVLDSILAKCPRFSVTQKDVIKKGIDLDAVYNQVETLDVPSISRVLTPMLEEQINRADTLAARTEVDNWGLPAHSNGNAPYINNYGGVTYNEIINDAHVSNLFQGQAYDTIVEGAIDILTRGNRLSSDNPNGNWVMPLNHPGMAPLAKVMDNYFKSNGVALANETQAAGVGIPVNQVSMLLVPTVWRMVSAFRMAQLHPMTLMAEDIPIERWQGQKSDENDWERWNLLDPGDSAVIPESVLNYDEYRLAAGYQPQHVRVTPRARALTRNTVMNPTMRSTALAAREIVDQNDLMLWRALIMEAMKFEHVKVSTWTALTRVGQTNTYTLRDGVIPYEWVVTEDNNDNVAKSGLIRNFPADGDAAASTVAQRKLQPLELREGAGDNTALLYGTDYTVDFVQGTITLTTAGRGKASTSNGVEAKYSYATNIAVWDAAVPSGSTFIDHLVDLRFKIADVRIKVKDRHYEPECLAWNYGLMDKISAGKNFTNEGTNAAQALDMMSTILRYAGSESIDSTAIPEEYVICSQKMSILFGMHTPFTLTGEVITDNSGDRRYFGEQFAGSGVPAPEKVSICIVKNVP